MTDPRRPIRLRPIDHPQWKLDRESDFGNGADRLEEDRRRLMEDEDRNRYVTDWLS